MKERLYPADSIRAVVLGVGVNDCRPGGESQMRDRLLHLKTALREAYPQASVFHVEAPAEKRSRQERECVEQVNRLAREVYSQIRFRPSVVGKGDPHYSKTERMALARVVLGALRKNVAGLRGVPADPWAPGSKR